MAINMKTGDSIACSSPRISFSHDLRDGNSTENQEAAEVIRLDKTILLDPTSEFNFCVTSFSETETSPADELFFNGVIIPTEMKEKLDSINGYAREEEEEITATTTATLVREEKTPSKSFWRFTRSSSLNCDYYGHKKSSFWSLPLLLRSKSTGSSSASSSHNHPKHIHKTASLNNSKLTNNAGARLSFSSHQKPPLKKNCYGGGVGGIGGASYPVNSVRNSPFLNVPSPYIAKGTSDLLGLGSLFRNGSKDKSKK